MALGPGLGLAEALLPRAGQGAADTTTEGSSLQPPPVQAMLQSGAGENGFPSHS